MITHIIEATNQFNWGKFMLGRPFEEWDHVSQLHTVSDMEFPASTRPVLLERGWTPDHLWVLDLETGEGAFFLPGPHKNARADLDKHKIWVCPLFEPFLEWVYQQDLSSLTALPHAVRLDGAESAMYGYRRGGSGE